MAGTAALVGMGGVAGTAGLAGMEGLAGMGGRVGGGGSTLTGAAIPTPIGALLTPITPGAILTLPLTLITLTRILIPMGAIPTGKAG